MSSIEFRDWLAKYTIIDAVRPKPKEIEGQQDLYQRPVTSEDLDLRPRSQDKLYNKI